MIMESDDLYLAILLYAGALPDCDAVGKTWESLDMWVDWYAAFRRVFEFKHPDAEEQDYTDHAIKFVNWCRQRAAAQRVSERRANAILKAGK